MLVIGRAGDDYHEHPSCIPAIPVVMKRPTDMADQTSCSLSKEIEFHTLCEDAGNITEPTVEEKTTHENKSIIQKRKDFMKKNCPKKRKFMKQITKITADSLGKTTTQNLKQAAAYGNNEVFEHAYSAGFHPNDILDSIASMPPTRGMPQLIRTLSDRGWDVVLLTDANTVFVGHWLKTHGLEDAVTTVITNRAFWQHGRLYIEPCMRQNSCRSCPSNLCKSRALAQWCAGKQYNRVIYAGDGRNDFCPASSLPSDYRLVYAGDGRNGFCPASSLSEYAIVFPRKGYPLDDLIRKTLATPEPKVKARVVPWVDAFTILSELFPTS
ncbi:unnamed protein product [Colias eurytheme]|nr:unnamed protein product [Colias eurytheme]